MLTPEQLKYKPYRHYWRFSENPSSFSTSKIVDDMKKIQNIFKQIKIQAGNVDDDPPIVNDKLIKFNAIGKDAGQTFLLQLKKNEGLKFEYCKTDKKPYDIYVAFALISCMNHCRHIFEVKSDGVRQEWQAYVKKF